MIATHRVRDSNSRTVGFILEDGSFYTDYFIINNIDMVYNVRIISNGVLRCNKKLPVMQYKSINAREYTKLVNENPFNRDIEKDLLSWKNDCLHKVLQLEGARQVGKTTELYKFGYKNYEYLIYINLGSDLFNFVSILKSNGINTLSMERYCRNANLPHYVNSKNTLLVIDEIQIDPIVYNLIRTFNSNLQCDLIVAGSYLGQTLKKEYFQPAGTVSNLRMFPLSFREFTRIFKGNDLVLDKLDLYGGSSGDGYKSLYHLYDIYRHIGGYPEVVKTYIKHKSINACDDVIENLLETFEKESRNYFKGSKETLAFNNVYTHAIREMCSEKKGPGSKIVGTVTDIVKGSQKMLVSRDEVSRAIQWLVYSGIVGECDLCNNGDINDIVPARRMYYMDCGIANYLARQTGIDGSAIEGFLTENFIYTELYRLYSVVFSNRKVKGKVPCFSTFNNYELNFMVLGLDNTVYGIGVKTVGGDPKSLKVFINKKLIDKGILAKRTKGGYGKSFDTIPIYAVGARFPYDRL